MAFGIDQTLADGKKMQSVSEASNVNTARIIGPDGNAVEQKTFGQVITTSSEYYLGDADTYINGATNGQTGQSVVTASTRTSTNSDYQRVSETKETCPSISGGTASA